MIQAADKSSGRLMIGYKYRCSPLWRAAAKAIQEGTIGTIRQIGAIAFGDNRWFSDFSTSSESMREMRENAGPIQPFVEDIFREGNWRGDPTQSGGSMFVDIHTHTSGQSHLPKLRISRRVNGESSLLVNTGRNESSITS